MSELLKLGQRVEVSGKEVQGAIAYIGQAEFAQGTWIGLILDEPKGKNNGTVQGQEYFNCEENHGMFVKENQILLLDGNGKPIQKELHTSKIAKRQTNKQSLPESRQSVSGSRQSLSASRQSLSVSRQSLSASRQSLSASRQSLSGSRQSLSGSRNSLSGSQTNLEVESSITEKHAYLRKSIHTPKKANLNRRKVTASSPNPITTEVGNLQMQEELGNQAQRIRDLQEKLETLKIKRQEDREKLKNYDKLKIQLEQLVEFKTKIMSSQANLQHELQRAKQEAKEAIQAKELHAEEVADLVETVEMATIDKEMAEEKSESLQMELEVCKEKLEEVTLDMELLKAEIQGKNGNNTDSNGRLSTFEIKQLQQQNERLRETLVKLRDLSAHDKVEYQRLLKDLDQKKSEITELAKTKEKLSSRIEEMEKQISELQEQVDAALGAEEMVIILGDQKLSLEEKVVQLQDEVAELEALQDMNDQLVESNAELEADLREEIDMAQASIREALHSRDAALETLADREQVINKFRQLVHQLQEQSLNLQKKLETETNKPVSTLPEIIDFKKMFTDSKVNVKTIDLELRRIDIDELKQHVTFLSFYIPDSFMSPGGDHDAVLLILMIPRIIQKLEIILGQVKDKFGAIEKIDTNSILKDHLINQYIFKCKISFYIYALQIILHQYNYVLNTCKPGLLLKASAFYPEIAGQEKTIDDFIELLKRDQLDENVSTYPLEISVNYFNHFFHVLFGQDIKINHLQLLIDNVNCLTVIADSFIVEASVVKFLIQDSKGEIQLLLQYIITTTDILQKQLKLIKRGLPLDVNIFDLGLDKEIHEILYECYQHAAKISKTLEYIVKTSIQLITSSEDSGKGLLLDKIEDIATKASEKIYDLDDLGPSQSINNSFNFIQTQITQLAEFLHDSEYEIANHENIENQPPLKLRAEIIKNGLEQANNLAIKLENKESDIKELRKLLKEKQELLSEMTIRKELAEKKVENINQDYKEAVKKLENKLEETQIEYQMKEREFEKTLDDLQNDIDSLEKEVPEMKDKLKYAHSEVYLSKGIPFSRLSSLGPNFGAIVRDSPLLSQEVERIRKAFHQERNERIQLQNRNLNKILDTMTPLPTFKKNDAVLEELHKEGLALNQDILMHLAKPSFPATYRLTPGHGPAAWKKHFAEEYNKLLALQKRKYEFQSNVAAEIVKRKFGGKIESDLTVFPTKEMVQALNENKAVDIGFVKVLKESLPSNVKPKTVELELDFEHLQKIKRLLLN